MKYLLTALTILALSVTAFVQPVVDNVTVYQSSSRILVPLGGDWRQVIDEKEEQVVKVPFLTSENKKYTLVRSVYIPDPKGKLLEFVSSGINYYTALYINDQFVGDHQGGFLPFRIKIPNELLNTGNSVKITLEIDPLLSYVNSLPLLAKPGDPSAAGGFLGDIFLQIRPPVSVEIPQFNYTVDAVKNEVKLNPSIVIQSSEYNPTMQNGIPDEWLTGGGKISVSYSVYDPANPSFVPVSGSQSVTIQSDRRIALNFSETVFKPVLWDLTSPKEYQIDISISKDETVIDKVTFPMGFRSVSVKEGKLILNGRETRLNGFSYIENYKQGNSEGTGSRIYKALKLIKSSGANSVRFSGFPPTQAALNICDSIGLMAFVQIPSFNIPYLIQNNKNHQVQSEQILRSQLDRERLHSSVLAVGIASGLSGKSDFEFLNQQARLVKSINPNILSFVVAGSPGIRDNLLDYDLIGLNMASLTKAEFEETLETLNSAGNYFVAYYGKEIDPENHNGYSDQRSQEFQAKYFMDRFKEIKTAQNIAGSFAGSLFDFQSTAPRLLSGNTEPYKINTGLLNDDLSPRLAYTYLKNLYNNEITFNPTIGKHSNGIKVLFPIAGVVLIFIFTFFFSSNRRFRDNMTRSYSRPFSFFSDIRDHRVVLGLQTFGLVFLLTFSWAMFFLSFSYGLRLSQTFDYLMSIVFPWVWVKETLIWWNWSPLIGMILLSFIILAAIFFLVSVIVALGWITKRKITFTQSLISVIWSAAPTLVIVLIAMVFEQIAISASWVVPYIFYFIVLLVIWTLYRIMKGLRIILVSKSIRVFSVGIFLIVLILGVVYFHYDYHYNAPSYILSALRLF